MQPKHQYEYAIVRVVPVVEREEFINAGVILFCKKEKFIRMKYHLSQDKILTMKPDAEIEEICKNLEAFRIIADGEKGGGPIASMEPAERFRWLSAVRSASIQTSRPHTGLSDDLEKTFNTLFDEMVG
jgi:hypothetical protein